MTPNGDEPHPLTAADVGALVAHKRSETIMSIHLTQLGPLKGWPVNHSFQRQSFLWALAVVILLNAFCVAQSAPGQAWSFAVSGDSRNCGDVVMPAIAEAVQKQGVSFYWHLGDFRALSKYDEDIINAQGARSLDIDDYQNLAWKDFIKNQIVPFGSIPVILGIGNHELVPPKTRLEYLAQFADWIDAPRLRTQRLLDDSNDHLLKTYYHWTINGVDFINLDNASHDQFDGAQLKWFEKILKQAEQDRAIKSVVVGMHAALPDSLAASHSMNDWAQGRESGRRVYADLLSFNERTSKAVYILASHSHFFMSNVFNTEARAGKTEVLPGWIIGTGGAVRYRLPKDSGRAAEALTDVYGYLIAHVSAGAIRFGFHQVREQDVPQSTIDRLGVNLVHQCFVANGE